VDFLTLLFIGFWQPQVIYGEDGRHDVNEVQNQAWVELSRATGLAMDSEKLLDQGDYYEIATRTYGRSFGLCEDERFFEQPTLGYCSGFLVGTNLVATAGHCSANCDSMSFVFDYLIQDAQTPVTRFNKKQVYRCKEVIAYKMEFKGADYALIELDRKVEDRAPFRVRTSDELTEGEELAVMGHPAGLPLKITTGARVRHWDPSKSFFVTNSDTFRGNSGSAIVNARTLDVEGILSRGEQDFEYDKKKQCMRSKLCDDQGCRGEDVTAIRYIAELLKSL